MTLPSRSCLANPTQTDGKTEMGEWLRYNSPALAYVEKICAICHCTSRSTKGIDSNGDPSKCIDPRASFEGRSPEKNPENPSINEAKVPTEPPTEPSLPKCKDKKEARFRINVSRERNGSRRSLQDTRQRRRNKPRGCKYIRKKRSRAQFWCHINHKVRRSCQRSSLSLS